MSKIIKKIILKKILLNKVISEETQERPTENLRLRNKPMHKERLCLLIKRKIPTGENNK